MGVEALESIGNQGVIGVPKVGSKFPELGSYISGVCPKNPVYYVRNHR